MDLRLLDPQQTRIHPESFVARGAIVVGDVAIGEAASVWFHVVIRGDSAPITVGARANVQDGSVVHVDDGFPCTIGEGATIGHACIIHGCTVGAGALVGMGSIVMNGVVLGEDCLVGAGSLVTEGKVFPPRTLVLGRPARAIRALTEEEVGQLRYATSHYVEAGRAYRSAGLGGSGR
jgi:carbonic anhydrase/acetyltransferase-like protein (isoleucine patch superfamily)